MSKGCLTCVHTAWCAIAQLTPLLRQLTGEEQQEGVFQKGWEFPLRTNKCLLLLFWN